MEFSRPEYWSGLPFPSPGDLPNPGIKLRSPILQADSLLSELQGSAEFLNEFGKVVRYKIICDGPLLISVIQKEFYS